MRMNEPILKKKKKEGKVCIVETILITTGNFVPPSFIGCEGSKR